MGVELNLTDFVDCMDKVDGVDKGAEPWLSGKS
jgi:hypothetical protein